MRSRRLAALLLVFGLAGPFLNALDHPFETGKILDIEQKTRTRVLYYLVNTPVTRDDPYYEVTVQLNNVVYVGQYNPVHAKQLLPQDWQSGSQIFGRVQKHSLFLKRPGEMEWQLVIVKRTVAKEPSSAGPNHWI